MQARQLPTGQGEPHTWQEEREDGVADAARIARARRIWRLTERETEVLEQLARGDANKDIATKLGCAPRTVEIHVSALLRKSRAQTRTRLALRVWRDDF